MGVVALDSSVVISYLGDDPLHDAAHAALVAHRDAALVISAIVLAEVLVGPILAGPRAVAAVRSFIRGVGIGVTPVDESTAVRAAELRAEARRSGAALRVPDALIVAAAEAAGAAALLTSDRRLAAATPLAQLVA